LEHAIDAENHITTTNIMVKKKTTQENDKRGSLVKFKRYCSPNFSCVAMLFVVSVGVFE
jgi:hypothetical protein